MQPLQHAAAHGNQEYASHSGGALHPIGRANGTAIDHSHSRRHVMLSLHTHFVLLLIHSPLPSSSSYPIPLQKSGASTGSFFNITDSSQFVVPLPPRAQTFGMGDALIMAASPGLADCVPMLFLSDFDWQLAFFQENGAFSLREI